MSSLGTVVTLTETPSSDTFLNWTGENGTPDLVAVILVDLHDHVECDEYVQANSIKSVKAFS